MHFVIFLGYKTLERKKRKLFGGTHSVQQCKPMVEKNVLSREPKEKLLIKMF